MVLSHSRRSQGERFRSCIYVHLLFSSKSWSSVKRCSSCHNSHLARHLIGDFYLFYIEVIPSFRRRTTTTWQYIHYHHRLLSLASRQLFPFDVYLIIVCTSYLVASFSLIIGNKFLGNFSSQSKRINRICFLELGCDLMMHHFITSSERLIDWSTVLTSLS